MNAKTSIQKSTNLRNAIPRTPSIFAANRCGVMIPFLAVFFPIFIILMIMATDYGVVLLAKLELQNAADAAAVSTLHVLTKDRTLADDGAIETITNNLLFGKSIDFTKADAMTDVEYGVWDAENLEFQVIERDGGEPPQGASAVRITLVRSEERNNRIHLFFAPVFGKDFASLRVQAIASTESGCSGFVGIESADLRNNIATDSYDSTVGDYNSNGNRNNEGDVCSGGPVTLASGADIDGDAQGSSVTISHGSGATISGDQINSPSTTVYPPIDFSSVTADSNGSIEAPPYGNPYYNEQTGDMRVDQGRSITLTEGVYHFNNFNLAGGSTLSIQGEVKIYVEGALTFDNGTVANLSQVPKDLQLFVGGGPVNVQGGNQLQAVIYSPEADINIANGGGFFGSLIGKTLTGAGGAGWHYDESLRSENVSSSPPTLVF